MKKHLYVLLLPITSLLIIGCKKKEVDLTVINVRNASFFQNEITDAAVFFEEDDDYPYILFEDDKKIEAKGTAKYKVSELAPGNYYFKVFGSFITVTKPFQVKEKKMTEVQLEIN